jgi:hypothetical protein
MAVALSRAGYGSLDEVMEWTPYRMSQVIFIHGKLLEAERRETLALNALGSRGDPKSEAWHRIMRDNG